jgi:hypothetical protein
MPTMVVEMHEQLLVRERELASWENALIARENNLLAAESALGMAHMECLIEHDRATAIQQDYWAKLRASTTSHRRSPEFDQFLSGCKFTLSV